MTQAYTIHPLGDGALLVSFGNVLNKEVNQIVLALFHQLKKEHPSFRDVIPAYTSLAIIYDIDEFFTPNTTAFQQVKEIVENNIKNLKINEETQPVNHLKIPVCYSLKYAPDLEEMAFQKKLSIEEVILFHTREIYHVYMIGFLPGFAYMGEVHESIATPRKESPRSEVAAGSVGIAGIQTGIYPLTSPGGWQIIGRTPVKIFDMGKEDPVLLKPGDSVSFYSITEDEFENY